MSLYIGLMSGTSMDAVNAALVAFNGDIPHLLEFHQLPLPGNLREALGPTCRHAVQLSLKEYGHLDIRVGRLFAEAACQLMAKAHVRADQIVAIGSHGQTVLHQPHAAEPFSLQIGDPNTIACITGITTVADFRGMDVAAGGQGAPLTPAFHQAIFRVETVNRVVLNIGGIANITVLPADHEVAVMGFDTGPGNAVLDNWARQHLGAPMDKDGHWGEHGTVNQELVTRLKADPYFQGPPPKSTGRDYFNLDWLNGVLSRMERLLAPEDVQASLVQLTADTIVEAIIRHAPSTQEVLVCGGGIHNPVLMQAIKDALEACPISSTAQYGLDPDCIEAVAFAWLAKCRLERRSGNLPSVTGTTKPVVLGAIYAGRGE